MGSIRVQAALVRFCAVLSVAAGVADARAQEPFYKGKRLTVIINFAAGGPTDIEGRLFAKYLARHIDGAPNLIVQNMDGAGGVIGAQYLGEIAPKDGTVMGSASRNAGAWISRLTSSSPTSPALPSISCAPTCRQASSSPPTLPRRLG
jgi:tripartite-type tricarboxylate transporter receptor subunit TctC